MHCDSIVRLDLLLDANMIPISMWTSPGNESENPIIRNIILDLESRNNIDERTLRIID